ncbi:molybdopterin-binding protein [Niveibacterium umoris]|uniref:Molybdopterin-biosynthesis enzyme MoeA-like protein n=1 Tax=Niveibacterium umoris TaxID=1193620 RepID=A0A840BGT8_9RHOO|nr:molybdopterin-binding protein [Niveibacterium umoris]MBB4012771.1 molybdopterin-biosynthesis enzyme MoeA-like protein [Niveibacterium umoris]
MAVGVLIIGDEILSGRRQDKHLAKSIELLNARGLRLSWARYCGDELPRLVATLRDCFASNDIFFSFGGIGATPDDLTRQAAAEALGVPLALHPEAEAEIRARFGEETTPNRLEMGTYGAGARIIPNPYNRIPGFVLGRGYFMPGFPVMAWPMMEWVLDGELRALHHAEPYLEDSMWVFDAQESQITPLMRDVQTRFGVTVFSLPNTHVPGARRQIELGAKGTPGAVAAAMVTLRESLASMGFETAAITG